jgi:hypothetical protein
LAALFAPASSSSNPTRSRPRPRSRSMQAAAKLWSEARSRARAASCANKPRRRPAERLSRGLTCSSSCSGPDESLVLVAGRPLCLAVTADGDGFSPSLFRHTSCTWGRVSSYCQASALPRQAVSLGLALAHTTSHTDSVGTDGTLFVPFQLNLPPPCWHLQVFNWPSSLSSGGGASVLPPES